VSAVSGTGAAISAPDSAWWRRAAYAWALVVTLGLAAYVARIPVQLTDSLNNLIQVQESTWLESFRAGVGGGYMRPALWVQIKAAFAVAAATDHYTLVLRGAHVAQLLACVALFVGALRVRDRAAAVAAPFGVVMLLASHTFDGTIREAFPINTFLTVILACLGAINLSLGRPALWRDSLAVALVVATLFTVETGALVIVCLVAAWLCGARGVSGRAVALVCGVLVLYAVARFALLDVGTPALAKRPSGFGFGVLEGDELEARFGTSPYLLYVYNVACQMLTVLLSEPRGGVWSFTESLLLNDPRPVRIIGVSTTVAGTVLLAWHATQRWPAWRRREFTDHDRVVLTFLAVLAANAVLSFPYTKDVVVSPAGVFWALAVSIAVRALIVRTAAMRAVPAVAIGALLLVVSAGWVVRLAGVHYAMRDTAFTTRNEWTELDEWAATNHMDLTKGRRAALARRLQADAFEHRLPSPTFNEWAAERVLPYIFE
jgi:hypothetical protein